MATKCGRKVFICMLVLGDSNFCFRFRFIIQFLPLSSMDNKAETEPKTALAKYDVLTLSLGRDPGSATCLSNKALATSSALSYGSKSSKMAIFQPLCFDLCGPFDYMSLIRD